MTMPSSQTFKILLNWKIKSLSTLCTKAFQKNLMFSCCYVTWFLFLLKLFYIKCLLQTAKHLKLHRILTKNFLLSLEVFLRNYPFNIPLWRHFPIIAQPIWHYLFYSNYFQIDDCFWQLNFSDYSKLKHTPLTISKGLL